jgi:CDP-paratose 2-epimerase
MSGAKIASPALGGRKPVLVTGGAGFIGCNLADRLAQQGHDVIVFDALARPGVERNLSWLQSRHPARITTMVADVRDAGAVDTALRDAQAVFHLAGQVAVTTSLVSPQEDFDINLRGTFLILEGLRQRGGSRVPLVFASTNKVYGDLGDVALQEVEDRYLPADLALRASGIGESRPLDFHTPYGCSKGAADQYVLDYDRSFGVPTTVLRMSCIYGQRQMGTEDQGWVAHFLIRALRGEPISIFGDGRQVRDVLQVDNAVEAYLNAWSRMGTTHGRAFNLGGGPGNAISLRQLVAAMEEMLGRRVDLQFADWRAGDQRYYVSDTSAVRRELGLSEPRPWREGIAALVRWLEQESGLQPASSLETLT